MDDKKIDILKVLISNAETNLLQAKQILEQLAGNTAVCDRIGKTASESVFPEYDENTMIEKLVELYGEILVH